jgi:hypothetical protein
MRVNSTLFFAAPVYLLKVPKGKNKGCFNISVNRQPLFNKYRVAQSKSEPNRAKIATFYDQFPYQASQKKDSPYTPE